MSKGLNAFATDLSAEKEGVWEKVADMEFLVAKAGNDNWKELHNKLEIQAYGPKNRRNEDGRDDETDFRILTKCLSYTCILDWKGVTLDGKPVAYSRDKCLEILSDKRFKVLTEKLLGIAMNSERFMEDMILEDEKK